MNWQTKAYMRYFWNYRANGFPENKSHQLAIKELEDRFGGIEEPILKRLNRDFERATNYRGGNSHVRTL